MVDSIVLIHTKTPIRAWHSLSKLAVTTGYNCTSYKQKFHRLHCLRHLFDVKFNELYWSIFIVNTLISTDPDLNVISCGRRQCYVEPWW